MPDSPNHVSLIQSVTSADSCNGFGVLNDDVDSDLSLIVIWLKDVFIVILDSKDSKVVKQ